MFDSPKLRVLSVVWGLSAIVSFTFAVLGTAVLATAPTVKPEQWMIVPILAAIGLAFAWLARRSFCTLHISNTIEHRQAATRRVFPLERALYIRIRRSLIMPSTVDAFLVVNDAGRERDLHFSEYLLFGEGNEARTRQLAALLKIPIKDPLGVRWRASPVFLIRWMGRGRLWAVWLAFALLAAPIVGLAAYLAV